MNLKAFKYLGISAFVTLSSAASLLAQDDTTTYNYHTTAPTVSPVVGLVDLAIAVLLIVAWWKIFAKAGKPGWAAVVPFYNYFVGFEVAGMSGWWVLSFLFFPLLIVMGIIALVKIAQNFGKGVGFILGLIFLNPIFVCILAFGDATYKGPPPIQA
jgi:hypothetical protein